MSSKDKRELTEADLEKIAGGKRAKYSAKYSSDSASMHSSPRIPNPARPPSSSIPHYSTSVSSPPPLARY